jgi:putative ABC transport system ATP-binding protein
MSGSGKSTLLHMLGGLDRPTMGTVYIDGNALLKMSDDELTVFRRRKVGFVFQSYNLVPILSVYENIVLPVELDGETVDKPYVDEILDMLGIADKRSAMPNQLSGGQQQRVAIARALASKPSVIFADEPTGNLDSKTSQDVLDVLKMTAARFNQTVMIITHNEHITKLADRVIHIEDGKIKSDEADSVQILPNSLFMPKSEESTGR